MFYLVRYFLSIREFNGRILTCDELVWLERRAERNVSRVKERNCVVFISIENLYLAFVPFPSKM